MNEDHPHACGDKYTSDDNSIPLWGSSPRVWGQVSPTLTLGVSFRIIPTRVGTSVNQVSAYDSSEDHPHACGDKTKEIKENSGFAKSTA